MLTIHNLMHQGVQHPSLYAMLGLEDDHYHLFDYPTNNLVFDTPLLDEDNSSSRGRAVSLYDYGYMDDDGFVRALIYRHLNYVYMHNQITRKAID